MTICKYFLEGRCRYGKACKYDHVYPQAPSQQYPQTQNQQRPSHPNRDMTLRNPPAQAAHSNIRYSHNKKIQYIK